MIGFRIALLLTSLTATLGTQITQTVHVYNDTSSSQASVIPKCTSRKTDPPSARTSNACTAYNGFECRSDIEIYISKTKIYQQKTPKISNQLFFVKSIAEAVTYLTTLYNSAHCRGIMKQDKKICVHDTNAKIVIALVIKNASMDILTAYPFRVSDISSAKCDATCNYP
ncbi:hypothetical protein EMCRGX_G007145 [Ephydatia muelleri]